ncbi:LacI family DNA-binding transcriptional regulator [Aeromonas schubertii]|uniref:LacI family DNA-binding transcriptional regulator n=1 Tax=Aeromonas schubertii TaxID=652 RepID=UPI0010A910E5|nr:LacI family DNA-binding transcriptional regulator [Aeromonas schubertii]QCG47849.1 LacI family DNA-binding transcriptional regulator [Aeromonas schubertii]
MATIKDVSRLANVSISTVSRVINNTAQVAPEKREAVMAAMKELNFRPNSFAQALVSKRSNCIGLLVGDLCGGPFFAQMMRGVERIVDEANKFTIVMSGNHEELRERHAIHALLQRQCDALILHSKALPDEELAELAQGDTPVIFINRLIPGAEDRCVWFDNQAGIETACQLLIDRGHSRIAFVTSDDDTFVDGRQRMEGYRVTLAKAGIAVDESLIGKAFADEQGGYVAMAELLERGVDFTAVLGFNDGMVAGAISCLLERGFRIPEQVSVVGFDDIPYARYTYPKLTTVKYPIEAMGERAAELALALLEGDPMPALPRKFEPELIVRESVA